MTTRLAYFLLFMSPFFETVAHHVAQAGLKLTILQILPSAGVWLGYGVYCPFQKFAIK
jgi:hypothetical protein